MPRSPPSPIRNIARFLIVSSQNDFVPYVHVLQNVNINSQLVYDFSHCGSSPQHTGFPMDWMFMTCVRARSDKPKLGAEFETVSHLFG